MNLTNLTYNLSYLNGTAKIVVNDIIKDVCNGYNGYIRTLGVIIVIAYIIVTLGGWWFWNKGYKLLPSTNWGVLGDVSDIDTRIRLDNLFRHLVLKWAVGYIVVVMWLSGGF